MALPVPEGFERATPYLCVHGAAEAIAFYAKAFRAVETMRLTEGDGRIAHAEVRIGGTPIMLSDEHPEEGVRSPASLGGTPVAIYLYVPDVDAFVERAVAAGARLERPVADQFYGDRSAVLVNPFGHQWFFATRIEEVSPEEAQRRYERLLAGETER